MSELLEKYSRLDATAQQEVLDFVNFLLQKKTVNSSFDYEAYRQRIIDTSVWSDEDIKPIKEVRDYFNN